MGGFLFKLLSRILKVNTLEETVNGETSTSEGTKWFSLKAGNQKYHIIAEYRPLTLKLLRENLYFTEQITFNQAEEPRMEVDAIDL